MQPHTPLLVVALTLTLTPAINHTTGTHIHSHLATATCYVRQGLTHRVIHWLQSVLGTVVAGLTASGPPQVPEEGGTAAIVPPQRVGAAGALPADLVAEAGFSPRQAPRRYGAPAVTATARGEEELDGV